MRHNPDSELRALERKWRSSGDGDDLMRYVVSLQRAGLDLPDDDAFLLGLAKAANYAKDGSVYQEHAISAYLETGADLVRGFSPGRVIMFKGMAAVRALEMAAELEGSPDAAQALRLFAEVERLRFVLKDVMKRASAAEAYDVPMDPPWTAEENRLYRAYMVALMALHNWVARW
jgi:hypothetical protein